MTDIQGIFGAHANHARKLELPGNPRYQPESLVPYFGYDNLVKFQIEVEWALLKVLAKLGIIPKDAILFLTDETYRVIHNEITTTLQDAVERNITHHDIRALVKIIQEMVPAALGRWAHIPATSYDIIDNARIIAYKRAFWQASFPTLLKLISNLKEKVAEFADVLQIGRTHGQHAEPITVGFWLATILSRIIDIAENLAGKEAELRGKFSGPVGSFNAQAALGFEERARSRHDKTFEELVLEEINLLPIPISTQILPPEPLARFLFEHVLLSGAIAQLCRDCRNLQRSEIAEVGEAFGKTQDGSSAMPHKRNPIKFEGAEGIGIIVKDEFMKVLDVLSSEHQRDGTGMCVMREFAGIVVLVQHQMETLNKTIPSLAVNAAALDRNFHLNGHLITSEAVYIALVMAGYEGDAHELINHIVTPRAQLSGNHLISELLLLAREDPALEAAVDKIPLKVVGRLSNPARFKGKAKSQALAIVKRADSFLRKHQTKEE